MDASIAETSVLTQRPSHIAPTSRTTNFALIVDASPDAHGSYAILLVSPSVSRETRRFYTVSELKAMYRSAIDDDDMAACIQ
jgi:hypothetical protein